MKRWLAASLLALLVTACATPRPPQGNDAQLLAAQAARESVLAESTDWTLTGRLSVAAAGEGGSGRIEWRQQGEDFEIQLSAPVTRKSWLLQRRGGLARLEGLDGGALEGRDAQALLAEATGWNIPIEALAAWARGARTTGPATIEFTPAGLPARISQQGWQVEYRDWDDAQPARPRRVFARQGDASVRLVVESWGQP